MGRSGNAQPPTGANAPFMVGGFIIMRDERARKDCGEKAAYDL